MSTPWMDDAVSFIGTKEIPGSKHNPIILAFFREAGFPNIKDDETAWCAAFANTIMRRHGYKGTKSLLARSFLNWDEAIPVTVPRKGDLVILKRGTSSWQGHVMFFDSWDSTYITGVGGNQSNAVTRARYRRADLLGFRRPKPLSQIKAPPAPTKPKFVTPNTIGVGAGITGLLAAFTGEALVPLVAMALFVGVFVYMVRRKR
jgi:uncharacterized protein (TIGR02594 family)